MKENNKHDMISNNYSRSLLLLCTMVAVLVFSSVHSYAQNEESDTTFSSVEERRLFQEIEEERLQLREDKKEVELKKKELKSLEEAVDKKLAELDKKLDELQKTQKQLEKILTVKSAEETKRRQDLAKIYEKMTPQKAAMAISGLNPQLATDLLAAMKAKSAAKILNQIPRQKATELSRTFSTIQLE